LNGCTITGNSAVNQGGGLRRAGGAVTITNCIVAGNTSGVGGTENLAGAIVATGPNLTTGNPLLAPLGNYGGPTQTMPPLPGSPAVDGCTAGTSFTADQRGLPRIVGAYADLGAVEGVYVAGYTGPGRLQSAALLTPPMGDGSFQFGFTNYPGMNISFSVWASTNVVLPLGQWSNLGTPVESPAGSGQFWFSDPQATNHPQRFYQVLGP
jgi:hypothetical protein